MTFTIDTDALAAALKAGDGPDLSGINFGLLEMLETWAEKEWEKKQAGKPSEWDQDTWITKKGEEQTGTACGTACCIAGKAIQVTPGVDWALYQWDNNANKSVYNPINILSQEDGMSFEDVLVPEALVPDGYRMDADRIERNGNAYYRMDASDAGRLILGLNENESGALFAGGNDLASIKRIMSDIRKGQYRRTYDARKAVPVIPQSDPAVCGANAQTVVADLVGQENVSKFYRLYGTCVSAPGHDGEHVFE